MFTIVTECGNMEMFPDVYTPSLSCFIVPTAMKSLQWYIIFSIAKVSRVINRELKSFIIFFIWLNVDNISYRISLDIVKVASMTPINDYQSKEVT